jgi:hypothetical protein
VSPIGDEGTEVRRRSNQILQHIVEPAAKECGYETVRADEISKPGMITSQVIQHLIDDPLVIADLAGHNPNVFYELAIRHAVRKPVVQLGKVGENIPFDVAQSRTIKIDHQDLDSAMRARQKLVDQIRAVEKNPEEADNPISNAIDVQALRSSANPLEKSHAQIINQLEEIKTMLQQTTAATGSGSRVDSAVVDMLWRQERDKEMELLGSYYQNVLRDYERRRQADRQKQKTSNTDDKPPK